MNKTFKVVFNKARGALMVVNEATSSIQSKGTKTVVAAAVGAMIAVTGTAMAETIGTDTEVNVDSSYRSGDIELEKGATLTITGDAAEWGFIQGKAPEFFASVTGNGNLVLKQTATGSIGALGEGLNEVSVTGALTIESDAYGFYKNKNAQNDFEYRIKAKTIEITAADTAFYIADNQNFLVEGFDSLTLFGSAGHAVNNTGSATLTFNGGNVTLTTEKRGALITMAKDATTVFNVDNLTVESNIDGQSDLRKMSGVYVSKGTLDVNVGNLVDITVTKSEGQQKAYGVHVDGVGSLTMDAKQIEIDSVGSGLHVVDAGSSAVVGAKATESVHIKTGGIAVHAVDGGQITLNGKSLNIEAETASGCLAGLWALNLTSEQQPPEGASRIVVNAANTTITAVSGSTLAKDKYVGGIGIAAMSNGIVEVNGNLTVTAEDAILTRGYSNILINQGGESTVKLIGNIDFNYDSITSGTVVDSTAKIKLTNSESFWTGRSLATSDHDSKDFKAGEVDIPSENPNFQVGKETDGLVLELSNGGTWNITGNSFVTTLALENGG